MRVDGGKDSIVSPWGILISLLSLATLVTYAAEKYIVLKTNHDVNTIVVDLPEQFSVDHTVEGSKGLNFAIGLVDYANETFVLDDPTYGHFAIYSNNWGTNETTGEIYDEYVYHDWH